MKILIGRSTAGEVWIDVEVLLKTRALLCAGSGGGKSRTLRRLAEQLFGTVPIHIIDREGEFASLREKFPYVLVGHNGDVGADIKSARILAERLMEEGASVIIDLYEAFRGNPSGRRAFVRAYLEAMVDAPKKLWTPRIVMVDEAHQFAPESVPKAANQTEREMISGCKDAMIALATDGRKRGLCAIWATQRLAKLDKDASAELLNRLMGMTIEDVDVDRGIDLMSVSKEDRHEFKKTLKNLEPGNFFGFGQAISKDRILFKVGSVKTTHPEAGAVGNIQPPPAPSKIKALLLKLQDLPKASEDQAKTEAEWKAKVKSLEAQLKAKPVAPAPVAPAPAPIAKPKTITKEVVVFNKLKLAGLERVIDKLMKVTDRLNRAKDPVVEFGARLSRSINEVKESVDRRQKMAMEKPSLPPPFVPQQKSLLVKPQPVFDHSEDVSGKSALGKCERAILSVLANYPEGCDIGKIALLSGYCVSGGFKNSLTGLRTAGYISGANTGNMLMTLEGRGLGGFTPMPQGQALVQYWLNHRSLGICERKILATLLENQDGLDIEAIAKNTDYAVSGGFKNSLSTLRTAGLLVGRNTEVMKASEELLFALAQSA